MDFIVPGSAATRAGAISIVCCALLSPSASANPAITRTDTHAGALTWFALAGPEVLLARTEDREMRLLSYPVAGGPGVERFRFTAPRGRDSNLRLAASSGAVGMILGTDSSHSSFINAQPYAGARGDALSPLGPLVGRTSTGFFPVDVTAAGGAVVIKEARRVPREERFSVYESGSAPVAVALPRDARAVDFAGELVAYAVSVPGFDVAQQKVVVREWRTGIVHWTAVIDTDILYTLDLRTDGAVVVWGRSQEIVSLGPGGSPVLSISRAAAQPVFAGDGIVFVRFRHDSTMRLVLAKPGQPLRTFGPPTARINDLVADGSRVAWEQNDCLLVADIADLPGPVLPPGPCPRSELQILVYGGDTFLVGRDRVVRVPLQCVAAAPPGCRGTVSLYALREPGRHSGRVRFTIRAGATRRFPIRLTKSAYAAIVREEAKKDGEAVVAVVATTIDQAGRRSREDSWFEVDLR